jgi:hypothetical protein
MAGGGDGGFAVPGDALRWIVSAAEAEAEHAEAALKATVPSMHDWWNGGVAAARSPAAAPAQKQKEKQKKQKEKHARKKDAAASGKEAEGSASAREAETSTRANLAAAVRFLASSGDDESS